MGFEYLNPVLASLAKVHHRPINVQTKDVLVR
jgi:hypothetical protein